MTVEAVRLSEVSFGYKARSVLRDISLSVKEGEFVSILGRNGSGKSTLLRCMAGLVRRGRSVGEIYLFGRPLSALTRREIATVAAYVPQSIETVHAFSVFDYVCLSRFPHRTTFPLIRERRGPDYHAVNQALSTVGMSAFAQRPLATLSGGECQKVAVAAALAQDTPLLLLDEPTASLDQLHVGEMARTLREIHRKKGRGIVMVTHDINLAVQLSNRIIALKTGAKVFDGVPADFMKSEVLCKVFDEQFVFTIHPTGGYPLALPSEIV